MELKGSRTEQNLLNAFSGESMARNKYLFFAEKAKQENHPEVAELFEKMAQNEGMHGKLLYHYLKGVGGTAENLREALEQEKLAEGEESSFGLFVKTVDGETVDDGNQEWWCLTKGGEMWNYGVDDTKIADGDAFEFTFTEGY